MRQIVSKLFIGLVTSPSEESKQLISFLEALGVEVIYHISPEEISSSHIENQSLSVWLLNVDDDHWHDNIDQLLDESDASIYFNEPGTLSKQSHPDFWCEKLVSRLYELTGLSEEKNPPPEVAEQAVVADPVPKPLGDEQQSVTSALESAEDLSFALDELETSSVGLPSDIAAELVSELENISPDLEPTVSELDKIVEKPAAEPETSNLLEDDPLSDLDFSLDDELSFNEDFSLDDDGSLAESELLEDIHLEQAELPEHDELQEQVTSEVVSEIMDLVDEEMQGSIADNEPDFDSFSLDSIDNISDSDETLLVEEPLTAKPEKETLVETQKTEPAIENIESSLSLEEPAGELTSKVKGRAQYVIDDQPRDSEIETLEKPEAPSQIDAFAVEDDENDDTLNLEPIETAIQTEPNYLTDETKAEAEMSIDDDLQALSEQMPSEELLLDDEFLLEEEVIVEDELIEDELIEAISLEATNIEGTTTDEEINLELAPIDSSMAISTEQVTTPKSDSFDIPMLEEAATGLDFEQVIEQPNDELTPCWVIGASLGGPAAVKRFLQSLPADINASFIVVQHIDENFLPVLADILTSNSHFEVQVAAGSSAISAGKVYLAPLKGKIVFLKDGSMLVDHAQKWSAPYMPCIDDVIESLAGIYGDKSGAIIFSGMGHDGLEGVKKMKLLDGQVWAQSVETCANSSMPESVINAGLASVVAAPEMLADRLVSYIDQKTAHPI